jgi:hypothetical protein
VEGKGRIEQETKNRDNGGNGGYPTKRNKQIIDELWIS